MLIPILFAGCDAGRAQRAAQAHDAAPPSGAASDASARPSCVDRELAARGLNPYGDPPDTMYAGGTPLFDEKTGVAVDRIEYVLAHRPEIASACATAK
jgi:hypothetical protein